MSLLKDMLTKALCISELPSFVLWLLFERGHGAYAPVTGAKLEKDE